VNKPDEMLPRRAEKYVPGDFIVNETKNELSVVPGCFKSSKWEVT